MKKILLIEDDLTMSHLLSMLLKLEGFDVKSITTIDNYLLDNIVNEKPSCILMDVHLRSENGIEITRKLRLEKNAQFGIILSSGMDLKKECLEAGANEFLLKPYMPDDLIKLLKGIL